jgi:hypothetical protein
MVFAFVVSFFSLVLPHISFASWSYVRCVLASRVSVLIFSLFLARNLRWVPVHPYDFMIRYYDLRADV